MSSLTIAGTSLIADSAVTTAKIADSNVTTAKIADSNVTAVKLATGTDERDWVLARTAATSVGAVGTYAFLRQASNTSSAIAAGATLAGSSLQYTSDLTTGANYATGATPSGTWRLMGERVSVSNVMIASVFLRIS